ncbi:MAG: coenzyme F390 synthetase [uncultured bacterium]|nr:MAG: coenzyme F390 synthetase [uncultured bacterium]
MSRYLGVTTSFLTYLRRSQLKRASIIKLQSKLFHQLLDYVFHHSPFYREFYLSHGIKEKDLKDITIDKLPCVDKALLMDNLDKVFTVSDLRKSEIEDWLAKDHEPQHLYKNKYRVLHTSGSSNRLGIFVYDGGSFDYAFSLGSLRISKDKVPFKKKLVYFGATHGHFTGASLFASILSLLYEVKLISALDPMQQVIQTINAFQPEKIVGYPSAISTLLEFADQLDLNLTEIITSGEGETKNFVEKVKSTWKLTPIDVYSTTESLVIGYKKSIDGPLTIFDDLNLFEVVDKNDQNVRPGETGKAIVTNLFNYVTPLIRYRMNDSIITESNSSTSQFTQVKGITARQLEPLPIVTDSGKKDFINALVLCDFFVPNVKEVQFVSTSSRMVRISYVSGKNVDENVINEFKKMLLIKHACHGTKVEVQKVDFIKPDVSGKVQLIRIER